MVAHNEPLRNNQFSGQRATEVDWERLSRLRSPVIHHLLRFLNEKRIGVRHIFASLSRKVEKSPGQAGNSPLGQQGR
jgi:hypothetical protein